MSGKLPKGVEANHLFANHLAKKMGIDRNKLLAVALEGSTNVKRGEHWRYHVSMKAFWERYMFIGGKKGPLYGSRPTLAQYQRAVENALNNATGNVFSSMLLAEAMVDNLKALKPGMKSTDRLPLPKHLETPKIKD